MESEDWSLADLAAYYRAGACTGQPVQLAEDWSMEYEDWCLADLTAYYNARARNGLPLNGVEGSSTESMEYEDWCLADLMAYYASGRPAISSSAGARSGQPLEQDRDVRDAGRKSRERLPAGLAS